MEPRTPHIYFSFDRLWTIARNTMTEVIRQKFFYILVLFGIVAVLSSRFFSQFSTISEQIKCIKDISLGAITLISALIAMVGTAQLLPLELDNRTIYPILAKPVFRVEFLLGKFTGMMALLFLTIVLMGMIFAGFLFYTETQLIQLAQSSISGPGTEQTVKEAVQQLHKQTRDPNLMKALGLIYFKSMVIGSISLLISTFATSVIFNVIASFMMYICGHLEATARQALQGDTSLLSKMMLLIITFFVPDLNTFNIADAVVLGQAVPWAFVAKTAGYGLMYSMVVLVVGYLIFEEKEI